ncbi:MAG: hypothetical protein EA376_08570 [Phycisphaeraceae bacterium]|nr:MAG: hypothetical protein EA376_08570 [Phycisphaeraceae bacterium]
MTRRGVTLLEAIVAMTVLASVAIVCLQVRTQGLMQSRRVEEIQRTERIAGAILDQAMNRMLPGAEGPNEDDPARRIIWRGEQDGVAWECVRELTLVRNPLAWSGVVADSDRLATYILVDQYRLTLGELTIEAIRPSGS